jgi:hypothetical protein
VLSEVVVVVDVASGLAQEILLGMEEQSSEFVELIIVGAMRSFQVGVFLGMALVVLDEPAAKAREQLAELLDFEPGLAPELLTVVYGEHDFAGDAVRPEPRNDPEVEAQAIGPGPLARVGDQLEARVDVQGAPLVVGDSAAVQVDDLLLGECLPVADVLHVDLNNLEGLSTIPVDKLALLPPTSALGPGMHQQMLVAAQDVADGPGWYLDPFVLSQMDG